MEVANLVLRVTNEGLREAERGLDRLSRASGNAEDRTNRLKKATAFASKAFVGLGTGFAAFGAMSIKTAGNFEAAMNGVKAVSGAVGGEFDALRDKAKELGSTTAYSATEAANGMEFLAMAGMNTEQVLSTIPNALNLAAAGGIDLARSADILSNIMTGMGLAAEDSGRAADVLAKTAASANVDISMLGETMKYAAPVAKQMGLSLEETAAMAGLMGNAGIQASQAGTSLRAMMTRLASNNNAQGALHALGVEAVDAEGNFRNMVDIMREVHEKMKDLGSQERLKLTADLAGVEGLSGYSEVLAGLGTGDFDKLLGKLESAKGTAEEMAAIRMEGFEGALKSLMSAWEGLQIAFADSGLLELATSAINKFAEGVRGLSENLPQITESISAFFDKYEIADKFKLTIEGIKTGFDNLWSVVEKTWEIMKPIVNWFKEHEEFTTSLALGIGAIASAFVIYNAAVTIGAAVTGAFAAAFAILTSPITLIVVGLTALAAAVIYVYRNFDELKAKSIEVWDGIKNKITESWDAIKTTTDDKLQAVKGKMQAVFESLLEPAQLALKAIGDTITSHFEIIKTVFSTGWEVVKAIFNGNWSEIPRIVLTGIVKVGDILRDQFGSIKSFVVSIWDAIKGVISNKWNEIKADAIAKIQAMAQAIIDRFNTMKTQAVAQVSAMKTAVINAIKALPSKMLQIGKDVVDGLINGIKSGVGRVGAAARNLAKSAMDSLKGLAGFDTHSPSKKTDKVGKDVGQGLANGIKSKTKVVKTEAQKLAESAISTVKSGIARLQKEIVLFGDNSDLSSFNYDVSIGKFKGVPQSLLDSYGQLIAQKERLNSLDKARDEIQKRTLQRQNEIAQANERVIGTLGDISKQIALFDNQSPINDLLYDINNTDKYADVTLENLDKIVRKTQELQNLKDKKAANDAFGNLQGDLATESPMGKLIAEYEQRLETVDRFESLHTDRVREAEQARQDVVSSFMAQKRDLMLSQSQDLFGNLAGMAKSFAGEQSGIYRAMFAVEKGIAIARSLIAIQTGIAQAAALPFPANLPAMASVASATMGIVSTIKSVSAPVGQAHDGIMSVPKSGTWNLEKGERVLPAHTAKAMDKKLENSGVNVTVNNYSTAKVETTKDDNGNLIMTIRDEAQKAVKQGFSSLNNPNSFESKQLKNNIQAPRRRA